MTSIGRLIGAGRSADIYEFGEGRVLRRKRSGPVSAAEPEVMRAARPAGFPVPQVHDVDGCDMVMDHVDGVDLLTDLAKHPWRARLVGVMLAGQPAASWRRSVAPVTTVRSLRAANVVGHDSLARSAGEP